jgi:hypothetical protein
MTDAPGGLGRGVKAERVMIVFMPAAVTECGCLAVCLVSRLTRVCTLWGRSLPETKT